MVDNESVEPEDEGLGVEISVEVPIRLGDARCGVWFLVGFWGRCTKTHLPQKWVFGKVFWWWFPIIFGES